MESKDLIVIGIGSSAGGLEALQILLSKLPKLNNCAYVIAQHLSPTHKSMMVELLSRVTSTPVIEIKNAMIIKANTIYMTPENTDVYVKGNKLFLKNIDSFGPKPSVNHFFYSLANSFKHNAIGIILSGTGSDGSYGIRSIKAEGGITIAQSPNTSKYDGMPLSAINTGKVDLVVSIDNIAYEIEKIVSTIKKDITITADERTLQQIFKILFDEFNVDFSMYKKSTILRRLERRMAALKIEKLDIYYNEFKDKKEEISALYHDILIGVTSFFRDEMAFDSLNNELKKLIEKKEQGEDIRIWSIGCSTGEEVYSLAIILSEILGEKISKYKIKIFATDIDDDALKIARLGLYAESSLTEIDKVLIKKYFTMQKNHFEVKKNLRELIVFSRHNIMSDSPFLRLDLVVCRNMLIYFSSKLQDKFFHLVHYSLNDNGLLFLGKSESIGTNSDIFSTIDLNSKIFKAQYIGAKEAPKMFYYTNNLKSIENTKIKKTKNDEELFEDKINEALNEILFNKCVIINATNDVIYVKGKNIYLNYSSGKVSNNIFKLISDELTLDLRTALNNVKKTNSYEITPFRSINILDDLIKYVRIIVIPLENTINESQIYVLFFQDENIQNLKGHVLQSGNKNDEIEKLTLELQTTKLHLQNVIEELETSYEETQGLNEELQSSNEELQSSNEELETTNEELQSTNEELQTAYSELKVLYEEKEKRTSQLESLMQKLNLKTEDLRKQKEITEAILDTAPIAVTMVDVNGQLIFVNKFAEKLYSYDKDTILNRTFNDTTWKISNYDGSTFDESNLPFNLIKKSYESVYDIKHTIESSNGGKKYLSISGAPLFDAQGTFKGAVFCIEDVSYNEKLKCDIINYQSTIENNISNNNNSEKNDLLSLALMDNTLLFKNELHHISLLLNNLDINSKDISTFNTYLEKITFKIDNQLDFYLNKLSYQKVSVLEELDYYINHFNIVLENFNIRIIKNINSLVDINLKVNQIRQIILSSIEMFIYIKKSILSDNEFTIIISNQELSNGIRLILELDGNCDFLENDNLKKDMNFYTEILEKNSSSFTINIESKINIEVDLIDE